MDGLLSSAFSDITNSPLLWPFAIMLGIVILLSLKSQKSRGAGINLVKATKFTRQPILNGEEQRLYQHLLAWMQDEPRLAQCRLFVQVSLAEIVSASDPRVFYRYINAKRVDFVLVDDKGLAQLAIEYQGSGHYGRNPKRTKQRDQIKQTVLERAGIGYLALHHRYHWPHVICEIEAAMGWQGSEPSR